MKHITWKLDHNPFEQPLGCNGKPGDSGRNRHKRRKEQVCKRCKAAANHTARERRRGQPSPRRLKPCGTFAAAQRHRYHNEPLCIPCQIGEAQYHADLRALKEKDMTNTTAQAVCQHTEVYPTGHCADCGAEVEGFEPADAQIPGTYDIRKAAA